MTEPEPEHLRDDLDDAEPIGSARVTVAQTVSLESGVGHEVLLVLVDVSGRRTSRSMSARAAREIAEALVEAARVADTGGIESPAPRALPSLSLPPPSPSRGAYGIGPSKYERARQGPVTCSACGVVEGPLGAPGYLHSPMCPKWQETV